MTGAVGIRVMRGPDWEEGDTDGGEGHLGTLKELLSNGKVRVLWDNGQEVTCRAGADGKFDLRIFDTAQAGVRHPDTKCSECGETHIYGMLWRCEDCTGCDLCPQCYSDDKHEIRHRFLRFDHYKSDGLSVKKRKVSVRMRSMGTVPGAKVTRGPDWMWGDQDGGPGANGEMEAYENVAPDSSRNLVRVRWSRGFTNSYRLGFQGNVDVICVEEETGLFYYRDHLPLLDVANLPYPLAPKEAFTKTKPSTTTNGSSRPTPTTTTPTDKSDSTTATTTTSNSNDSTPSITSLSISGSTQSQQSSGTSQTSDTIQDGGAVAGSSMASGGEDTPEIEEQLSFVDGDDVMIGVNENKLRDLQEDFGGVSDSMIKRIGQKGKVTEVTTGIMVRFTSLPYRFNPLALVKVTPFKEGDVVRVRTDPDQVKLLNKHIAWNQQIAEVCGSVGRIVSVDDRNDSVMVNFGHYQTFRLAKACCVPSPGATVDPVGAIGAARRAKSAAAATADSSSGSSGVAGGGGGSGGGATGGSVFKNDGGDNGGRADKRNSDNDSDSGQWKAMLRMLGMMDSGGSGSDGDDPQMKVLFSAIARGEANAVETLLQTNMSLMTKTIQTLSPLMYACHKGQREIVTRLLDLGAEIDFRNEKGRTALHISLDSQEEEIALLLLGRRADPNVSNHRQRSALHEAAFENLPQALQVLVANGADVNAKDFAQDTPLFDAIEKGNQNIVEILLKVPHLNREVLNRNGFNMLQLAALKGHAGCVEAIISSEGCPPVDDLLNGEYSALHIAANNDHVESVGILVLLGGATIDIGDGRRQLTPLHLACKRRNFKSAEALIGLGATVNVTDVNGHSPLHLAMGKSLERDRDDEDVSRDTAIEQRTRVARLLLSNGAILDLEDDEGKTPMSYAHREVQENIMKFLQQSVADFKSPSQPDGKKSPPDSTTLGVSKDKTMTTEDCMTSKQYDKNHINNLLKGVSIPCVKCDVMSDVTLQPCGHKSLCRKCCNDVTLCPTCDAAIDSREPDNTDTVVGGEEEMNKFD
ncbi:E3 ubiquitin-protein ligase MIB2-like [Littorina saxatilis]|uniref:RING-type E3 ubiquitin transferase n=1 Tax=Littorina saxatilis TaxID=31220 RepID=A0AAN9AV50_9CAEN